MNVSRNCFKNGKNAHHLINASIQKIQIMRCLSNKPAVILGCYQMKENGHELTNTGKLLNKVVGNKLEDFLNVSNFKGKVGTTRTFYDLHQDYPCISVAGLGKKDVPFDDIEERDDNKENVRIAVGAAAKSLRDCDFRHIAVDGCAQSSAAAEGANLSTYEFDEFKSKKKDAVQIELLKLDHINETEESDWNTGMILSQCQNFARGLMEMPSNYKPPSTFAEMMVNKFEDVPNVEVLVRDEKWAEEMNMNCFLSVGRGSEHRSVFLEIHYRGSKDAPFVLVGKGITFDTGGISIKPSNGMGLMRGDMGGAACVLATLDAVTKLRLPINLVVLVPLAENMPSGSATKPGDVFTAMNGKTVEVDNTDAEGRLVLADALCYASQFNPTHVINVATLTGAMDVALGAGATGTYTTCNHLWSALHQAGMSTGDRVWKMPIFNYYKKQMECSKTADFRNTQKKARSAGSNTAAAFLKEFVDVKSWAHLDIAGVMTNEGDVPYLGSGMSGRPSRTLIEAVRKLTCEK